MWRTARRVPFKYLNKNLTHIFFRDWIDYEEGFGDLHGNYWLGLTHIRRLTANAPVELLVYLEDFEHNWAYAQYASFQIAGSNDGYRLSVSGYSGTAGDSLAYQNGRQFITRDSSGNSCGVDAKGAWWYVACYQSNLNGEYGFDEYMGGVDWQTWKGYYYSLKTTVMKLK